MSELTLRKPLALRKRTIALLMAVVLAALATVALISYVRGLEAKAFAGATMVEVLVAKEDIPARTPVGTAIARGLIARQLVPQKFLAAGALTSLASVQAQVASVDIVKGEQLLADRFVAPGGASGTILPIPAGHQAMALAVSVPHGVAGFIVPGNHVSIISQFELPETRFKAAGISDPKEARYLLQDIEVLAVNQQVVNQQAPEGEAAAPAADTADQLLLTLAVTASDAERLAYSAFGGENLWVTLLPQGQKPVRTTGRNPLNIVSR